MPCSALDLPGDDAEDQQLLGDLTQRLGRDPGVAFAIPPVVDDAGDVGFVQVFPRTSPQDEATSDLVHRLRDDVVPAVTGTGADGLARTARVITAAAAIMICVFAGFMLSEERALQLFGMGLAVAVLVDATIVRLVLVPATMELLGDRNWWIPRWLGRVLPTVDLEGTEPGAVEQPEPRGEPAPRPA